jgi:hypothetical protein
MTSRRWSIAKLAALSAYGVFATGMAGAVNAHASSPWHAPLSFGLHAHGWRVGQSGTYRDTWCSQAGVARSAAWAANVRYRDSVRSDPPNATLRHLPPGGVVVWASIQRCTAEWPPSHRHLSHLDSLEGAWRWACCDGAYIRGGVWELYGFGPDRAYSVLIRIYWGSPPTAALKAEVTRAVRALRLPAPR